MAAGRRGGHDRGGKGAASSSPGATWRDRLGDPQLRVALVTAACLLAEAVIAKNVLDTDLDFMSQTAPMWVFIAYLVSGSRSRASEIAFMVTIVLVTVAVIVLYAV